VCQLVNKTLLVSREYICENYLFCISVSYKVSYVWQMLSYLTVCICHGVLVANVHLHIPQFENWMCMEQFLDCFWGENKFMYAVFLHIIPYLFDCKMRFFPLKFGAEICKVILNLLMKSNPDCTILDCPEPDHTEPNKGLPHEITRFLLCWDIVQCRMVISHMFRDNLLVPVSKVKKSVRENRAQGKFTDAVFFCRTLSII
jgi:hypothetical protein